MIILQTWVDALYVTHINIGGYIEWILYMGVGAMLNKFPKQKLNTKSPTEAEIIGVNDYVPWTLWAKRFLEDQGFILKKNTFTKTIWAQWS